MSSTGPSVADPTWALGLTGVAIRAVRGATQVDADDAERVLAGTRELVTEVLRRNDLAGDDLVSILFTATPDLRSAFPAWAARQLGLTDVPLLCARELDIVDAMPRVIRLLAHAETPRRRAEIRHVFLHGAASLREDLPQ